MGGGVLENTHSGCLQQICTAKLYNCLKEAEVYLEIKNNKYNSKTVLGANGILTSLTGTKSPKQA